MLINNVHPWLTYYSQPTPESRSTTSKLQGHISVELSTCQSRLCMDLVCFHMFNQTKSHDPRPHPLDRCHEPNFITKPLHTIIWAL
jgi:hypothetical protein